ncbi:Elongation factor 1-beta [Armadillidium vulgare]|nr:Elongation factor 1-beta [Armadillidium vulgare]
MNKQIPSRQQVLRLYKDLINYGKSLKFTDKEYYVHRIQKEFKRNKTFIIWSQTVNKLSSTDYFSLLFFLMNFLNGFSSFGNLIKKRIMSTIVNPKRQCSRK